MTVAELIKQLQEFDPDLEVVIRDSFNGAGIPRTINFGPIEFNPLSRRQHFTNCDYYQKGSTGNCTCKNNEALDYSDLKSLYFQPTIHMGYGCY